jgi:NAD(P)-dependent dehydrogenase (short-subunit alcohol dehydrogenase family)
VAEVAEAIDGLAVRADISRPPDVARMLAAVLARFGPVDILINNAGVVWPLGRSWLVDPDAWESAVSINLFGAVRCIQAVLPDMLRRRYGRILNLSSGAASGAGMPSASAYSASKAALDMVTANVAAELAGTGVTINGLRPGTADTAMQEYMRSLPREQVGGAFADRSGRLHRDGQLLDPRVAAGLALALIATDRNGVTVDVRDPAGQALLAAGG